MTDQVTRARGAAGRIVRPAINNQTKIIRSTGRRWSDAAEREFLGQLAASANVRLAAEAAGFSTTAIYKRRMAEPGFADRWQMALEQGIARLEMQLVEIASSSLAGDEIPVDKPIPRMTPTEAMNLIKLHRSAIYGGRPQRFDWRTKEPDIEVVRRDVLRKVKALEGR